MTAALAPLTEPARVWTRLLPERRCMAAMCELPAAGICVYLTADWSELNAREICGGHITLIRDVDAPALVFPLDRVPPFPTLLAAVNAEITRRRPPQPQMFGTPFGTGTTTTTWTWAS